MVLFVVGMKINITLFSFLFSGFDSPPTLSCMAPVDLPD